MNTTLQDNNYHHPTDLACCLTCKHSERYGGDIECGKAGTYAYVSAIGICDKYERDTMTITQSLQSLSSR